MTEQDTAPDLPVVIRDGEEVRMKLTDFDALIVRLLNAEANTSKSWWRP